ncbi:MAG: O-antigen ligase family protein [Actinomycetota bacterium]
MQDLRRRTYSSEFFWSGLAVLSMLAAAGLIAAALLTKSPVLVVAGTVGLLGCAVIIARPFIGILLFLTLMYTRPELFAPQVADMRLPLVISVLTLFAWGIRVLIKQERFIWRPELAWVGAFGLTMLVSAIQVPGNAAMVDCLLDMLRLTALVLILQQLVSTEGRAHAVLQLLLGVTVILALYAIHGWVTESAVLNEHGTKRAIVAVGDFDDPNDLSAALVIPVPIALLMLMRARSIFGRIWGLATLGALLVGIYLCNSRGGMLALGVALGVFLIYSLGWKKGCILGAVALAALLVFAPNRFSSDSLDHDDSSLGRIEAWDAGLQMFQRSPLLGVGYDQFEERHVIPAHNSLVHGLAESGLFNAIAWVGLNYWAILTLIRLRRSRALEDEEPERGVWLGYPAALQAGLLASLTAGFFLSHTFRPVPLIPVALAAALGGIAGLKGEKHDWVHALAVVGLTLVFIGMVYVVVAVVL